MNAAGKHQPDLLERPASLLVPTWTKTGLALLYDEHTSNTYDIRLKLTKELLIIQKQDVVCINGDNSHLNHRTVVLRRQATGGLGLSIKGGAEHKVPVVISKIFKDQVADQTGMLFIGDAVLQVNGINVEKCTHEEVVHLLRTAGEEVTITVRYLREVPAFLKLPLGSPGPSSDHSSRASSPLFDSGLHLNGNSNNTAPSSPCSPSDNELKYEKRWLDAITLPLFMSRISRRKAGTDKLRSNSFEVIALDGVCTHVLQFCTPAESTDWLQEISTNINDLTQESIKTANKYCSPEDQIVHMGWVCEHVQVSDAEPIRSCRFLVLRGSSLLIFRRPPVTASDWTQAEASFHLCEVLFKVHKLWIAEDCWIQPKFYVGVQQDGELRDSEPFCFSVLVGHGQSFCYSVELGSELVLWEKAFQRAMFIEVQRVRSKSYMCSSLGKILSFTIDFESGFSCSESVSKKIIWKYKFSQLKGSSDDGKTRVKLLFQNSENKQIEMKELEFANLTAVLHCIHAFIAAKVATVDPVFVNNQRITQKYMSNS
ncbi:gamma-2-syntrophin-like isoform X2 [Myxocyprinus asiaticus]|uniref:gamma-2-syntrophin-like isoform X2 n=1 Tax=Myxocyprinus asiaticus TaxID=70543 RepID=UPI00222217F6|nr:gamma-2-syntrophin-like isoform X2 [Myxocyprinus asiaticus]